MLLIALHLLSGRKRRLGASVEGKLTEHRTLDIRLFRCQTSYYSCAMGEEHISGLSIPSAMG
jgi:hypothetical protein